MQNIFLPRTSISYNIRTDKTLITAIAKSLSTLSEKWFVECLANFTYNLIRIGSTEIPTERSSRQSTVILTASDNNLR